VARWIGAQGQVTSVKKARKYAPIMTSPTRNPKSKSKKLTNLN